MQRENSKGIVGNYGFKIKGDCQIEFELTTEGGIEIEIFSKVKTFYGNSIRQLCITAMKTFSIQNACVTVRDNGALSYVIAARLEAAIKQVISSDNEILSEFLNVNHLASARDRNRFSRLYLPGNTPYMMINAGLFQANGIILDLEDAVSFDKKEEARYLVRNALRSQNFYGAERMVRINQGKEGWRDLEFVIPQKVNLILIPKCEDVEDIIQVERVIEEIKKDKNIKGNFHLMPIIESALGVENAFLLATASENIVAMAIGLEDYTADIGVERTNEGTESLYARMRIVNACHAAKIQPIDSVFSDVGDMQALAVNVQRSKSLGFQGMGCIHPRQIKVIHDNFSPSELEIAKAKKIVNAFLNAEKQGFAVVSVGTKMIDPPVVKRQLKVLELAIELGLIEKNWKDTYGN
ncbi:aldolase/citrate lyase family protein [Ancylomarina longa]|uniref:Citrate lyase ACP n=1 Tax=Ancylomarina longa TaxID=2487017 RepID=A0A434AU04_9BACT|nr:aldolase/citrate lyase family protein [Ancylomarina longa]RUT77842.1 citrate lyase ACP [Ancylomarina longa]